MQDANVIASPARNRRSAALLIAALWVSAAQATLPPIGAPHDKETDLRVRPELSRPAVPLEAFFADPEFAHPQLSPDGRQLAVLHDRGDQAALNLKVIDLTTHEVRSLTSYSDHDVAWYVWLDNERIAYRAEPQQEQASDEWLNVVRFRRGRPVTVRLAAASAAPLAWSSVRLLDPRPIASSELVITARGSPTLPAGYADVARLDVRTGEVEILARNPGDVYHWLVDRQGQARIAMSLDEDLRIHVRHRRSQETEWADIHSFGYGEAGIWPIAFTDDPNTMYVLSDVGRDTRALYTYDLSARKLGELLFAHDQVDVSGLVLSRDGSWPIGARYETDRARMHYFDPMRQAIDAKLAAALSGYEVEVQFSDDGQTALVTAHNEKNPGRYYHFDATSGRLREMFSVREFLPEEYLSPTLAIDFDARDGERLHGFMTVPRGAVEASPMVVVVHGGPHEVRDRWGFDPEVQFLANRGYAVLQVNFRGSAGYGRRFEQLGWGRWGETVQQDIADAVHWAVDNGYGDPGRICIYGWSFGGYSALMNMALHPELYRCGVSFGGVTDLSRLVAEHSPVEQARQSFLGLVVSNDSDGASLALSSPINRIDDISAPVLVAHGLRDDIVPVSHFERFVAALAIYEKPGEGLLLEDQGHGLNDERARYLFYRTLEAFLARHLGSEASPEPDAS